MFSLKTKILGLTILITVVATGLSAWHNVRIQQSMLQKFAVQNGRILGETVRNSIASSMAEGKSSEVYTILKKISDETAIDAVRIFDLNGRILLSNRSEEVGDLVGAPELLAFRANRYDVAWENQSGHLHSAIVPIPNSPSCYSCHGNSKEILGVLDVRISLKELESLLTKGRHATLFSSAAMLTALVLVIGTFLLAYIDKPIRKLIEAMNHVEQGSFDQARTAIHSSVEMSLLSRQFNSMVDRLKNLIDSTVRHEREIAVAKEKLAHHDEINNMNQILEDRLQEIEHLNLTLEERIEEIEEANYKIADLASDLEEKNLNLEGAVNRLSALNRMGLALNSTMDLDKLFELLIRRTMEPLKAGIGYILLLDRSSWTLRLGGAAGIPSPVDPNKTIPLLSGGISNWVIENAQPLLLPKMSEAREFSQVSQLGFTRDTVICAPLMIKDEVIGTITMTNKTDDSIFNSNDLELLSTIAAQASVALKNARLYEEQERTYLSTVQALVSAIEANDSYTRGHSDRVTRYCIQLAKKMNLPSEGVRRLEQAAILHDIGKIGIDPSLLHKEELLSEEDLADLRKHPQIGVKILGPIHFLHDILEIIEQHHERFDGQGYPCGLRGEQMLVEAKILAVADSFDAMTSDRPYRSSFTAAEALKEIGQHAGTQFDPEVARIFIDMFQRGEISL